jgi:hypothetical protein
MRAAMMPGRSPPRLLAPVFTVGRGNEGVGRRDEASQHDRLGQLEERGQLASILECHRDADALPRHVL